MVLIQYFTLPLNQVNDKSMNNSYLDSASSLLKRNRLCRTILFPANFLYQVYASRQSRIQKKALINLSKLLTEEPVLSIDEFKGKFSIDHRSHLFSRLVCQGNYEPKMLDTITPFINKEKDTIDVRGNIVFYTVWLAKFLKKERVLSTEPTLNALNRLYRNIKDNQVMDNTIIFEGVVTNQVGSEEMNTIEGKEEYSSIGKLVHQSIKNEPSAIEKVASSTIDNLVEKEGLSPFFIKIDIKGSELLALKGADFTHTKHRPIILSELSDELLKANTSSFEKVTNYISSFNYDIFDPYSKCSKLTKKRYGEIVCFPKELKTSINF